MVKNGPFVCCELNKARQSTCTLTQAHPFDWHSTRDEIFDIHFTKPMRASCNRSLNQGVAVTLHIAKGCSMWSTSEWSVCFWSQWHWLQTETWPPSPRWPTSRNRKRAFTDSPSRHIGHRSGAGCQHLELALTIQSPWVWQHKWAALQAALWNWLLCKWEITGWPATWSPCWLLLSRVSVLLYPSSGEDISLLPLLNTHVQAPVLY